MSRMLSVCLFFSFFIAVEAVPSPQRYEFKQFHMGTLFRIVLYSSEPVEAQGAANAAFERIEELENILSMCRENSELRLASKHAFETPQVLSPDLYSVLDQSLQISRLTNGAFDVTIRPLVEIWRRARRDGRLPDQSLLEQVGRRVGYTKVLLNPRTLSLRFRVPGVQLDLGGIGKGCAADQALLVLREHQIESALVYAGGDIRIGSPPVGRKGWTIELSESEECDPGVVLSNCAIASSGDAFQFAEIDGIRYSHIIDPLSGLGIQGQRSATVIAPRAIVADALATALSVLGPEDGIKLVQGLDGVSALFVRHEDGKRRVDRSAGFPP